MAGPSPVENLVVGSMLSIWSIEVKSTEDHWLMVCCSWNSNLRVFAPSIFLIQTLEKVMELV